MAARGRENVKHLYSWPYSINSVITLEDCEDTLYSSYTYMCVVKTEKRTTWKAVMSPGSGPPGLSRASSPRARAVVRHVLAPGQAEDCRTHVSGHRTLWSQQSWPSRCPEAGLAPTPEQPPVMAGDTEPCSREADFVAESFVWFLNVLSYSISCDCTLRLCGTGRGLKMD